MSLLLLVSSCGLFKEKITTKTDSIFIDKTKTVLKKYVDTIVVIKSDTSRFSFKQPKRDTIFTLADDKGTKVRITLKNEYYYISSISLPKQIPIKITETTTEYRNIYIREKVKTVVKKTNVKKYAIATLLIVSFLLLIFIFKQKLINYAA